MFLHELVGELTAGLIAAESRAARASLAFLKRFGFEGARGSDWGDLRFITFHYTAIEGDGADYDRRIRVPLLSLLPVPMQAIDQSEFEFFALVERDAKRAAGDGPVLRAEIAPYGIDDPAAAKIPRVRVKLVIKQSDMPSGVRTMLRTLDDAIREVP